MSTTIYEDRSNPFTLTLLKNNVILTQQEMVNLSKFEIRYQDAYYDSEDYPSAFVRDNANGQVEIKPATLSLSASRQAGDLVEFIVYDTADHVKGLVWSQFTLIVKDDAALLT